LPAQVAPVFDSAPAAVSAPLKPIPAFREQQFIQGVADRVREGAAQGLNETAVIAHVRAEREALAAAIDSQPVRDAFAASYHRFYNVLRPITPISLDAARLSTNDIIAHRINDARYLSDALTKPDFLQKVRDAAAKPPVARPLLAPERVAEMIERFAEDTSPLGVDGITHAQHSMAGHQEGHLALAQAYAPDGGLRQALEVALAQHLPPDLQARHTALAADWLKAREDRARATVAALAEDGEVYQGVMARVVKAAQPSAQASHIVPQGMVQPRSPANDVMMDRL